MSGPVNTGALSGLRVIDLTQMLAGPYCTMLLADQGADVIKVEPVNHGDMTRMVGPFFPEDTDRRYGGYFESINRNKRSIALDLKTEKGRAVLLRLISTADVVAENFRVGVMDRLGLSYENLARENPKLVYAAIRGFGDPRTGESPYATWPAFDVVAQAMGGIMGITGPDAEHPTKIGPGVGDIIPAMLCTIGILSAVYRSRETGEGQFVDVSMYDGILATCERIIYQHKYTGRVPGPEGNGHPLLCPFGLFPANDGWVAIACPNDAFWRFLVGAMGRSDLAEDQRYSRNDARAERNEEVVAMVSSWTSQLTKAELKEALGGHIPFGPVNDVTEIFEDPHVATRQMLATFDIAALKRSVTIAGTPIKMTASPGGVRSPAPQLGQHTADVLAQAGLDADQISALKSEGVIG